MGGLPENRRKGHVLSDGGSSGQFRCTPMCGEGSVVRGMATTSMR